MFRHHRSHQQSKLVHPGFSSSSQLNLHQALLSEESNMSLKSSVESIALGSISVSVNCFQSLSTTMICLIHYMLKIFLANFFDDEHFNIASIFPILFSDLPRGCRGTIVFPLRMCPISKGRLSHLDSLWTSLQSCSRTCERMTRRASGTTELWMLSTDLDLTFSGRRLYTCGQFSGKFTR